MNENVRGLDILSQKSLEKASRSARSVTDSRSGFWCSPTVGDPARSTSLKGRQAAHATKRRTGNSKEQPELWARVSVCSPRSAGRASASLPSFVGHLRHSSGCGRRPSCRDRTASPGWRPPRHRSGPTCDASGRAPSSADTAAPAPSPSTPSSFFLGTATLVSVKAGMNVDTRSASVSLPSSISDHRSQGHDRLASSRRCGRSCRWSSRPWRPCRGSRRLEHHDLAVARDQHDCARQLVVLHALVQPVAETLEPRREETDLLRRLHLGEYPAHRQATPAQRQARPQRPDEPSTS